MKTLSIPGIPWQPRLTHRRTPIRPVRVESPRQPIAVIQPIPVVVIGPLPRPVATRLR